MNLTKLITSSWAIMPNVLDQIQNIFDSHMRGPKLNLKEIETKINSFEDPGKREYQTINGTAIISIIGPTSKRPDIFDRVFFGMSSTEQIKNDFLKAIEDAAVNQIVLYMDTPGGSTDGVQELAQTIFENRGKKSIYVFSDGMIASAGVWYGSAADKIFISGDTVMVGSIGVIGRHIDMSKMNEMNGVVVTEIVSGQYKNLLSSNAPLSQQGKEYFQSMADYLYTIFVNDVAKFRGTDPENVLKNMADGRLFIGQQAIDVGLVDGVSTIDDIINGKFSSGAVKTNQKFNNEVINMPITKEQLIKEAPELYQAVLDEGKAQVKINENDLSAKYDQGTAAGIAAEQKRVKDIMAASIPGHEKLIQQFISDGKTTGAEAALAVIKAENEFKSAILDELKKVTPVAGALAPENNAVDPNAPVETRAKAEWDKSPDIRGEFGGDFEAYLSYKKADESGQVMILNKGGKK